MGYKTPKTPSFQSQIKKKIVFVSLRMQMFGGSHVYPAETDSQGALKSVEKRVLGRWI